MCCSELMDSIKTAGAQLKTGLPSGIVALILLQDALLGVAFLYIRYLAFSIYIYIYIYILQTKLLPFI